MRKLKLFFACLLMAVLSIGQMWGAKDDVVYTLNTASTGIPIASSTTYQQYTDATNGWKVTCGAKQTSTPQGLWLGSNNNQKAKMILNTGSFPEASGIASAISVQTSSTYYAAIIGTNALANVGKVTLTYNSTGGTAPSEAWILYSTNNGTTWSVGKKVTTLSSSGTDFEFDETIASARYAFVIHSTGYCQFKVPVLTFYEGTTGSPDVCADPVYDPNGGSVESGTEVTITTETEGATIYYTMGADPADPTSSDDEYADPIEITASTTIKAIAIKEGLTSSNVVSKSFTVASVLTDEEFAWSASSYEATLNAENTYPSLTNTKSLEVTYQSTDENVATIDAEGTITLKKAGTTTIKAIFAGNSTYVAKTVSYTLNVAKAPDSNTSKTLNLAIDETDTKTDSKLEWVGTYVTVTADKADASTATNNYCPPSNTSTRFYKNSNLTITPENGYVIDNIEFSATSANYASALQTSSWTNASAVLKGESAPDNQVVVVTASGSGAVSATIGNTCGFTQIVINYHQLVSSTVTITNPAHGTITVKNGETPVDNETSIQSGTVLTVSGVSNNEAYRFGTIRAYKTDDAETTVTITNGALTMPAYPITITADETQLYSIEAASVTGGTLSWEDSEHDKPTYVEAETLIQALLSSTAAGYEFVAFDIYKKGDNTTKVNHIDGLFEMPEYNVVIGASFNQKADPEITLSQTTDMDFGAPAKGSANISKTFTVTGANLESGLTVAITSEDNSKAKFSVDVDAITAADAMAEGGVVVTVTATPDEAGDYLATITVDDGENGATAKSFDVLLSVQETYTAKWYVNGAEQTGSTVTAVAGTALTFPTVSSLPEACTGLEFKGWLTSALAEASATEPAELITTTAGITMPEDDVDYYAVFAEEVPGEEVTNTYSYTLEAKVWSANGSQTLSNVSWTLANNGNSYNYDATKGQQVGSGNNPASTMSLTTSGISGKITSVKIYTSGAKDINAAVAVSVNNVAYKYNNSTSPVAITNTNTGYEFTGSETGAIEISWAQTSSKALYFKQIDVKYATPSASTYANYVTTCVACSRVTLEAAEVEHGSIKLQQDSKDVTSVKTCDAAQTVNVVASPDDGYELSGVNLNGFEGANYNNGVISINQNASGTLTATATFALVDYAITYTAPTNGTYTIKVGDADAVSANTVANMGQTITLAAEAAEGYLFTGWTVIKTASSEAITVTNNTFTMPAEAVTVAANFARVYSVADFIAIQDKGMAEYCIEGIVSYVKSLDPNKYTNAQYYISANGQRVDEVYIYNGKYLNGADFTSTSQLAEGDKVIVCGTWDGTNSRVNAANYLISRVVGAHDSYEIVGDLGKSNFMNGEKWLDSYLSGLSVNDVYNTGYKAAVSDVSFSADKTDQTALESTDTQITVTATKDQAELATKDFAITVSSATLVSIALKDGYKTEYYVGDEFVKPTVTATLSDNSQIEEVATACTGYNMSVADNYTVSVAFTYGNITLDGENGAEYQITVKKIFDNEDAPHTVAKAIELIQASAYQSTTSSTDYMWVSGKVVSAPNNSGTYTISDDGTSTNALTVWAGKYFDSSVSAKGNVAQGDEVILKGTIVNYNGNQAELTGSTVVSQLRAGALSIEDVTAFEVGADDVATTDLVIVTESTGEITFVSSSDEAVVTIVEGKLHAVAAGTATITANLAATENEGALNYSAATTTFDVTVVAPQVRYAVTFIMDGGSAVPTPSLGDQLEGANVEIPAGTFTKDGYKFNGWTAKETESGDAITVSENAGVYSFTMPAAAVTVTAQWVEGSDFTWDATAQGYSNEKVLGTECTSPVTITFAKASASNDPKYYTNDNTARFYTNGTLTITAPAGKLITAIMFNTNITVTPNVGSYESATWSGLADKVIFTAGATCRIKTITVTYINGTITTLSIEDVSLKLLEETKNLSISCNVDPTPAISYEIATADQEIATIENGVVTAHAVGGPINVTANIVQGSNYTAAVANFTITVTEKTQPAMSFPQASYDANLGSDFEEPALTTDPEGIAVTYSSSVPGVATVNASTGEIELKGEGTTVITAAFAGNDDYSANSATYTLNVADPYKDVLTAALIGQSSYGSWNDKTFGSGVKYAGYNTTGSGNTIQMNANPGGIVTTSAIGYLKELRATAGSSNAKKLQVYAKNTAYESSADLYDAEKRGEQIGTIAANGGVLVFDGTKSYADNYKYIGIKSEGGAVYFTDITIKWTPVVFEHFAVTYKAGEATGDDIVESIEEGSNINLKAADTFEAPEGKIFAGWLLEGEQNVREAGSKYTVTAAATFTAQWVSVYTITYTAGDGTGEDVIVPNVQAGDYELADNTFTAPENMEFAGWKLNNAGETLAAGANYNVSGNASFTAQWSIVKQAADLAYATTSYIITRGREFEAPELTNPHGLAVTYSGNNDEVATVNATTGALTLKGVVGEVTVTATSAATDYYYAGEASYTLKVKDANLSGGWVRLTNANALVNGMNVIIAEYVSIHNGEINTMGAQNTNNRGQKVGALQNDTLISDDETPIFTLVKVGENTFAFKAADNKYLYAASSGSNHLKSQAKIDGNATWTISLSGDGKATITAQGTNSHNLMRYNSTNEIFSCYGSGQQDIALYSKTVAVSGNTNASTLDEYADVVVADGGKLVINAGTKPLGNITGSVEVNAPLQAEGVHLGVNNTMEVNSTVNVPSFSISVKLGSTGQATNVNVSGNGNIAAPEGYVDMELSDGANPDHWHSFTVPFEVDALNGIYDAETGAKLVNETNYAIMDYHGDIRANGKYGWKKYRGVLQPGVFYLITIDGETKVLRFMKKDGSSYVAGNSMEMEYHEGEGASSDFGWCGVGNQNMFNGYVPSQYNAQVLNATGTGYELIDNTQALSACIPFFIQVNVTVNLVMQTSAPSLAPRRTPAPGVERMKVFFGNENYTDKLFISASEEALNEYEIGKDLLKMTMTNTPNVAQIFGNAYGKKLCVVNAPMVNDQAEYSLTLYAPEAGEYTISAPEMEDADLYLTKDGAIIWNLSTSEYTTDFTKGNNEGYGLMLIKKAPGAATGTENIEAAEAGAQKVVINNNVYILRNEQMYDVTGKAVK